MKALEFVTSTGDIKVVEIPKPTLPNNPTKTQPNLLVKVVAAAIDAGFAKKFPKGKPDGFFIHSSATPLYLGWHFSGVVEEIAGDGTSILLDGITVGTAVFGFLEYSPTQRQGSFAEYILVNSQQCGIKPDSVSFELAAASATESATAIQALRDCGRIAPVQSVLICGAGGGVGSAAICAAKIMGARVTAMCSERDEKRLQETFQPDAILNRSQYEGKDPIKSYGEKFDIIFDCPSAFSPFKYLSYLKPNGAFVVTSPSLGFIFGFVYSIFTWWTSKRVRLVTVTPHRTDFTLIGEWLTQGKLKIPIEATFDVTDMAAAIATQNSKTRQGRVVIKVQDGWKGGMASGAAFEPKKDK
jgi:NADPH:quinone reductase-like Zn-dependent oxidoreductase